MSSMPSIPTDRRTKPGVTPAAVTRRGELAVCRRSRVDDQRPHVADVGDVAVQGQCIDEPLACIDTAVELRS